MNTPFPFIVFEGCDGVGKTTIRTILTSQLGRLGYDCTILGQHSWLNPSLSRIIIDVREGKRKYTPEIISESYFQDKRLHAQYNVIPALSDSIVIADRYIFSDAVYQEVLYGLKAEDTINRHYQQKTLFPDICIYVETPASEAYKRVLKRSKAIKHYEHLPEMTKIIDVYNRLFLDDRKPYYPPLIRFNNSSPSNLNDRIEKELLPSILDEVPALKDVQISGQITGD